MQIERIKSTVKPNKIESLKNGFWYYNYDIQESLEPNEEGEDMTVYNFIQVRIEGNPTYDKCVKAIIRAYIDINEEFNLINSFNAYQLDVDSIASEYEEYLRLLKEIKNKVRKDFQIEENPSKGIKPKQSDLIKLLTMTINQMSLSDEQSLEVQSLYPNWEDCIGKQLQQGSKIQYDDKLFKVVQTHTVQEDWKPGINTASLYTQIVKNIEDPEVGTLDNPIEYPSDGNMIIYNGKYYIENGIIYLCNRDSGIPLYTQLANVVNIYVIKVE